MEQVNREQIASAAAPELEAVRFKSDLEASRSEKSASALASGIRKQLEEGEIHKVAIAQIKALPTRLEYNFRKICDYIDRAKDKGVQLLVFPELAIPGYLALDNFDNERFVQANLQVLRRVIEYTAGSEMTVMVGFVNSEKDPDTGKIVHRNTLAVMRDGKLMDVVDKTLLPDYDIFWEGRHFAPSVERHVVSVPGAELGAGKCEDLWDDKYPIKVYQELAAQGATIMINSSASPFEAGKYRVRHSLVSGAAKRYGRPFLYANLVGVQDGYEGEVIFDGRSMIVGADGSLLALGKKFEEDLIFVDLHKTKEIALPEWSAVEEVHDALVLGLREYCERNGFKRIYIGMSGGVDSALTVALAVEALGPENVIGVTMPSHITSEETMRDALLQAKRMGIRCDTRSIAAIFKAYEDEAIKVHGTLDRITKQNFQARIRGNILMEYSNEDRQGLVVSTGNKTELALGYCTLYGDMSGGISLISDVSKEMVYELAKFINARQGAEWIPLSVIERAPTAELEPGQTDEANLPAPYSILSPLVDELAVRKDSMEEIAERYPRDVVDKTARMMRRAEFKRRQAAPGFRVTEKAFGAGRRFPVDDQFDELSLSNLDGFRREHIENAKKWIVPKEGEPAAEVVGK